MTLIENHHQTFGLVIWVISPVRTKFHQSETRYMSSCIYTYTYTYIYIEREVSGQGRQSEGSQPPLNFGGGGGVEPTLIIRKICELFGVIFLKVGLF